MRVFHLTEPRIWQHAQSTGEFTGSTRGASLADVGFVHCSFADQVEKVATFLYGDWSGELVLLEIDTHRVPAATKVENLDGGDELFPHVYGPIPVEAVVAVQPYPS